jgi:2-keto-4-pentenoate hydratase
VPLTGTDHPAPRQAVDIRRVTLEPTTRDAGLATTRAADRLLNATTTHVPCIPVRDLIGSDDVLAAYAVQQRLTQARLLDGARVVGRKIGLTSPAVQAQLGVDQPDFGMLFDDMAHDDGAMIPFGSVLQPRVEAEIAFVLKDDLVEGELNNKRVRAAIDYGVAALEICGSRIRDWDISFGDTVADNASAGAYVLGGVPVRLDEVEPREVEMTMSVNGEQVSTGSGAACLGDPVNALMWLARQARKLGEPLRSGQVVLSGALGPMFPIAPGAEVTATITGLGTVSCTFTEEEE